MMSRSEATTWKRYIGNIIDYSFMYIFIFFYLYFFGERVDDGLQVNGFKVLPIPLFWFIYFILIESIFEATLGYQALGLRVIREDQKRMDLKDVFLHHILDSINLASAGLVSYLIIRRSDKRQSLGGVVAGTITIEDL